MPKFGIGCTWLLGSVLAVVFVHFKDPSKGNDPVFALGGLTLAGLVLGDFAVKTREVPPIQNESFWFTFAILVVASSLAVFSLMDADTRPVFRVGKIILVVACLVGLLVSKPWTRAHGLDGRLTSAGFLFIGLQVVYLIALYAVPIAAGWLSTI